MQRSAPLDLGRLRERIDAVLSTELERARAEAAAGAPEAADVVDELSRLVRAGGKRLRPILCVLGHVAAGGGADDVLPAAAGMELFHTFALVHDDVMDDEDERRGVQATHRRFANGEPGGDAFGRSAAILVGDVAIALAFDLVLSAPLPPERVLAAAHRIRTMALATAAGQYLDIAGIGARESVSALKTAAYTADGPLAIGAELAGATGDVLEALGRFARPFGVAFQILDDVADGTAPAEAMREAHRLLDDAASALRSPGLDPTAAAALGEIVSRLREAA